MKKYLISGAMALLAGFYLTSCTEKVEYDTYYDEKMQTYEQVFKDLYGNIAPDHDWGFKSLNSIAASGTRMAATTRMAGTRGENANANEWADPNKEYGGWLVPDPLTEGQKLRVKAYFQANPDLDYINPKWKNFFVQQVYKGATGAGDNSTEKVIAADGSKYDSNNMNLLTVGQNAVHINNFNRGDAESLKVLDNGHTVNEIDTYHHYDKIMLMVNIYDTSCFGYHETGSSNESDPSGQHNDRCALVSAAVIDAWAANHGNVGEKVLDDWNRSFLGFDLAIKEGDQIYTNKVQKYTSGMNMGYHGLYYADGNIVYFENGAMPDGMEDEMKDAKGNPLKLLISNTNFYSGDLVTISDGDLRKDINGKVLVNMVKVNELIAGGYYPVDGSAFKTWVKPKESFDGYYSDWIVTLTQATSTNDTPGEIPDVPDTPTGQTVTKTSTGDQHKLIAIGRVFVEDLFKANREDLDFNDAVFDAAIWETTTNGTITVDETTHKKTFTPSKNSVTTREVEIYLIAAGGTIPLSIAGSKFGDVHDRFRNAGNSEVSGVTMVNTRGQYSTAFGSYVNGIKPVHDSFDYTKELKDILTDDLTLNDISVDVIWTTDQFSVPAKLNNAARIVEYEKDENGNYITTKDENGNDIPVVKNVENAPASAPHMICVPLGTPWATERVNIADCYNKFKNYVNDGVTEFWNQKTADSQFNLYEQNVTTFKKENYGDGTEELTPGKFCYYTNVQEVTTEKEITIWESSTGIGYSGWYDIVGSQPFIDNNVQSTDILRIYGVCTNNNGWQLKIANQNWKDIIYPGIDKGSCIQSYGTPAGTIPTDGTLGYQDFPLTENTDGTNSADILKDGGVKAYLDNLIIKKIVLVRK